MPSTKNETCLTKDQFGREYTYYKYEGNGSNQGLAKELKFIDLGVKAKIRTPREMVDITKRLKRIGVRCPQIVEYGDNYSIEQFMVGDTINQVRPQFFEQIAENVLHDVVKAHLNGVIMGNRWWGSQLVNQKNRTVSFIDFNVVYEGKYQNELEIAEILNALTWERGFEEVVFLAERFIGMLTTNKVGMYGYNIGLVQSILDKHIRYWSDPQSILGSLIKVLNKTRSEN